jgi:hypothetical protein
MERGVCDGNLICAGERRGTIAPMTARSRFAGLRLACRRRIRRQNGTGFLRTPFPQQSLRHGMERGFQLLSFGFAQRRARAAIDNLIQFVQVYVNSLSHRHH